MPRKLIEQDEAARTLGISVEELNLLREKREIFGTRDGGIWKYKPEDLERYQQQKSDDGGIDSWSSGGDDLDSLTLEPNDADSILLSEIELGESPETTSSTIIGKSNNLNADESDVRLAAEPMDTEFGGSDVRLVADDDDDVRLVPTGGSDVLGKADDRDADLSLGDSGLALADSAIGKQGSNELSLGDDDLVLADSAIGLPAGKSAGSDELNLAGDDDEMVLGGPSDSDITLSAGDSGISLVDPADSGLSLDEAPLELGGSGIQMMELGEEDVIALDDDAELGSLAEEKGDDDFLLTPMAEATEDESDSGSQVIALDSEEEFSAGESMFAEADLGGGVMLEEDTASSAPNLGGFEATVSPAGITAGAPAGVTSYAEDTNFSLGSVVFLICCSLLLMISGMMMYDLVRHMWAWDQPYSFNSTIMDGILGLTGDK